MAVAGREVFQGLQQRFDVIHPFNPSLLDGDGYVLTVRDDVSINYLQHLNLISNEVVFVPPTFVAHLTSKSKFGRMGLSFLNAAKVHSGFVGRLALEVVNLNNERKTLKVSKSDPFVHFELIARDGAPAPYEGGYMFQCMDEREVEMYVRALPEKFPGVFQTPKLQELAAKRVHSPDDFKH